MAYPLNSGGLDPRMQRIIEAAGAGDDGEHLQDAPCGRPPLQAAQASSTRSRHFENGSSLQKKFVYQASPKTHPSLSRQSVQPMQPSQQDYHIEQPYSKSGLRCSDTNIAN